MGWGEFFSLASPMVWALAVVLFRRSGETLPAFELNLCKNTISLACLIPAVLIFSQSSWPGFTGSETLVMVLSGLLGMAVADTLYFRALILLGASRTGIIGSLLSPFVILISAVLLGERLALWQWLGFALVMGGILLVTWRRNRTARPESDVRRGVILGASAMFLMALGVVMVKPLLEQGPFLWVTMMRVAGGVAGMLVYATVMRNWRSIVATFRQPQPWRLTLTASVLGGFVATVLWLAGYKLIPASEASIYNEAQGSFIVLFAWLILGETIETRKLLGLALTIAGVITMLLA